MPARPNTERIPIVLLELSPVLWRRWIGRLCVVRVRWSRLSGYDSSAARAFVLAPD